MQYEVEIDGELRRATVHRDAGRFVVELDGRRWIVDAARVDRQSLSLLLGKGVAVSPDVATGVTAGAPDAATIATSCDVIVTPNGQTGRLSVTVGSKTVMVSLNGRRRSGRHGAGATGDGPQRIVAPMPGKVVRVLGRQGDAVVARQPLVVIEAMKMENELRAGRDGVVAEIHVREGQSVEAGELLAIVARA